MPAHRKPCPYGSGEELVEAVRRAGGTAALSREIATSGETIRRWARDLDTEIPGGRAGHAPARAAAIGKIADLLAASGIDPEDVGKIQQIKLTEWQAMSKDDDGNPVVTDLKGSAIVLQPKWAEGPAWPVIQPAPRIHIRPTKARPRPDDGWKRCVTLSDNQIGYIRDLITDELVPFHDERAMAVALQIVADIQPDLIIHFGDSLDFAEFSRFAQQPGFQRTTQPTIDRAGRHFAELRATAPRAEIRYLEGNHEARLPRWTIENAKALFGIRQAMAPPESWPINSIPHLLNLDDVGVDFLGGYPAGITWINDRLACIHGHKVKSNGSTAAAVIDDESSSILFGHIHRIELQHKTKRVQHGGRTRLAASAGCLCRTDGTVPSTRAGYDPMGRPVATVENWQQGLAVVTYKPGDSPFHVELIPIHNGEALFRGRMFAADEPALAAA